jgi:RNA polymerase sigma-70 factor (ECF subfamily)
VDAERTDAELARAIAAAGGDAKAAEAAFVRRFAGRIRLYAVRHLRDRALLDDLVQHVLVQVLEALRAGRLENPERLASFVLGTCRNATWDTHRAEARQRSIAQALGTVTPLFEAAPEARVPFGRLFDCLLRLPDRESRVLRMTFLEDRAAEEVGQRLGLSAGNVRVIKHRALGLLGTCVGVEERP